MTPVPTQSPALPSWATRLGRCLAVVALQAATGCATGPHPRDPFEPFNRDRAPRYLTRLLLTTVSNIPLPMHDTLARAGVTVLSATVLDKLGDWLLRWLKAA